MRRPWALVALSTLVVWDLYFLYGLGLRNAAPTLGGATIFLVAVPVAGLAVLLCPGWEKEAVSLLLSSCGFVALNHLLTYFRHHPVGWPPPVLMAAFVAPLLAALTPLLSLNYWFARKPEQEPALAGVLLNFFLVQIFPIFGLAYAAVLIPAVTPVSAAEYPAYMIAVLFGGLTVGSLLARWLLRRMTGQQIRGLLLPSVVRKGRSPDLLAWTGLVLLLGAGMWLEHFRGEWVAWTMQALGILTVFQFVWRIYREVFTTPVTVILPPDAFQIPSFSMVRVGVFLWVLMSLSAVALGLIRVIW